MKRVVPVGVAVLLLASASLAAFGESAAPAARALKPALLVIDVQNEFGNFMSEADMKMAPMMINGAISLFREHGLPVIRVYHTDPQWGPAPDSEGFRFFPSIIVKDDDPKVIKNYPSAFKKTDLEKLLRDRGCNTLFLCGLSATGCVLATYHGAQNLDFEVFMVKGALISPDAGQTQVIEDICETVSYTALKVMLDSSQR